MLVWLGVHTQVPFWILERKRSVGNVALPSIQETGPHLTPLHVVQQCPPAPHSPPPTGLHACPPYPTSPQEEPSHLGEAALILLGHKGAVELPVHCTSWRERVLTPVPVALNFLWYLWICVRCVLSNLAVQTRQLVLVVSSSFFPLCFPWTSPFWVS